MTTIVQRGFLNTGNVKRQKVLIFANKHHVKRITSFAGFVAKIQQSLKNNDSQFIYYVTKKLLPFITLLRENGIIHKFYLMTTKTQRQGFDLYLSPDFDARLMVVHLKETNKYAPAIRQLKTFTVPSRRISITYIQLLKKTLVAGTSTLYILNTPKGLLTHIMALQYKIGGEIVCEIH